jgi:hypothetical protein
MAFTIKKGDTSPFLTATLKDANGTAVDLTSATVVFNMADLDDNKLLDELRNDQKEMRRDIQRLLSK